MKFNPLVILTLYQQRIKTLLTKRVFRIIFFAPIVLIILTLLAILFLYRQLPPEIPLYYSRPWGTDQITSPMYLLLLPLGSLFWYILTNIIIAFQTHQYRVFSQLLLIFSFFTTILATYAVMMILILVL